MILNHSASVALVALLFFAGCSTMPTSTKERDDQFELELLTYVHEPQSAKSLIIMPPTGGTNTTDRSYAKTFFKKGYDVYVVNDWSHPGESEAGANLGFHERAYANALRAIDMTLAKIKSPFIGMIGTSVGATYAAIAANKFERLDAIFFIVGGIPLTEVIVTSDHPSMKSLHKKRFASMGFKNDDEYQEALKKNFHIEPESLGSIHESKQTGAVVATEDTTVPTKTQNQLVSFFRPKTVLKLDNGHFWAIVKTWLFHTDLLVEFFETAAAKKHTTN